MRSKLAISDNITAVMWPMGLAALFRSTIIAGAYCHEMGHQLAATSVFNNCQPEIKIDYYTGGGSMSCGKEPVYLSQIGTLLGYNFSRTCLSAAGWVGEALFTAALTKTLNKLPTPNSQLNYLSSAIRLGLFINNVSALAYAYSFDYIGGDSNNILKYGGEYAISFMLLVNTCVLAFSLQNSYDFMSKVSAFEQLREQDKLLKSR